MKQEDTSPLLMFLLLWLLVILVFGLSLCSLEEPRAFSSSESLGSLSDSKDQQ